MVEFLFKNKNTTLTLLVCNTASCMEVTYLAGYLTVVDAAHHSVASFSFFRTLKDISFSFCSLQCWCYCYYCNSELGFLFSRLSRLLVNVNK